MVFAHSSTISMSVTVSKRTRMSDLVNYRLKIHTVDNRTFVGRLLAFDKHLNLVLSDTEELRITNKSLHELKNAAIKSTVNVAQDKRLLGLIILRGDQIVNLSIESGPTTDVKKRLGLTKGSGILKPLKVPVSQRAKLQGPARGFKRE